MWPKTGLRSSLLWLLSPIGKDVLPSNWATSPSYKDTMPVPSFFHLCCTYLMSTSGVPGAVSVLEITPGHYLIRKCQDAIRAPVKKTVNGEIANDFLRAGLSRQVSFEQPTLWRNGQRTSQVERLVLLGSLHVAISFVVLCIRILTVTFTLDLLALEKVHLHVLDHP